MKRLIVGCIMMAQSLFANGVIPREKLFKPAEISAVKISPKGQVATLKNASDGTNNLYIDHKQVTFFEEPLIHHFFWSSDFSRLVFLKDVGGSRDSHIMGVDLGTLKVVDYTENFDRVLGKIYGVKGEIAAVGISGKNPLYHDVYSLNLRTGELKLAYSNERFARFFFDENLQIALKGEVLQDGSMNFMTGDGKEFLSLSPEDAFHTTPLLVHKNTCFMLDTRTTDTTTLIQVDLKTREETRLAHDDTSDIQEVVFEEGRPIAYSLCHTYTTWHSLRPDIEDDLKCLVDLVGSEFSIMSQQEDHWVVRSSHPTKGVELYQYNRKEKKAKRLSHAPEMKGLFDMRPVVIQSRDGLNLVSYLTLPNKEKGPFPLVLIPHGGPFQVRDAYEYNPYHQWLASRGYAVLSVNYRSSSGFGKNFVCAGNGEWGGKAQNDLIDAAEWCIEEGIADRSKIAIYGGSYGGYAGLAALTFTPEYFAGVVAACGPSNLKTVLDKVPLYWESPAYRGSDSTVFFTKGAFVANMGGDPDDEKGSAFLHSRSPLNFVEKIERPLLLIHGSNDPIVAQSESDQIFHEMKERKAPPTYLVFPDEGHGLSKLSNKMAELYFSEKFLAEVLGGEIEPLSSEEISQSSVCIIQ